MSNTFEYVGSKQNENGYWYMSFNNVIMGDSRAYDTRREAQDAALAFCKAHDASLEPFTNPYFVYQP